MAEINDQPSPPMSALTQQVKTVRDHIGRLLEQFVYQNQAAAVGCGHGYDNCLPARTATAPTEPLRWQKPTPELIEELRQQTLQALTQAGKQTKEHICQPTPGSEYNDCGCVSNRLLTILLLLNCGDESCSHCAFGAVELCHTERYWRDHQ